MALARDPLPIVRVLAASERPPVVPAHRALPSTMARAVADNLGERVFFSMRVTGCPSPSSWEGLFYAGGFQSMSDFRVLLLIGLGSGGLSALLILLLWRALS